MNPYRILNIGCRATKKEIVLAAARALRERKFSAREVAQAQKALLDPISKAAYDFAEFIDLGPLKKGVSFSRPERPAPSDLKRLSVFEGDS